MTGHEAPADVDPDCGPTVNGGRNVTRVVFIPLALTMGGRNSKHKDSTSAAKKPASKIETQVETLTTDALQAKEQAQMATKKHTVAVIGGSGLLGKHIVNGLLENGHYDVTVVSRKVRVVAFLSESL